MANEEVRPEPKISVSFEMKISLGNYQSAGGSCVLSGLTAGTTGAEVDALLETAAMSFDLIREKMELKLEEVRAERGS